MQDGRVPTTYRHRLRTRPLRRPPRRTLPSAERGHLRTARSSRCARPTGANSWCSPPAKAHDSADRSSTTAPSSPQTSSRSRFPSGPPPQYRVSRAYSKNSSAANPSMTPWQQYAPSTPKTSTPSSTPSTSIGDAHDHCTSPTPLPPPPVRQRHDAQGWNSPSAR